jgi:hypothetical protein
VSHRRTAFVKSSASMRLAQLAAACRLRRLSFGVWTQVLISGQRLWLGATDNTATFFKTIARQPHIRGRALSLLDARYTGTRAGALADDSTHCRPVHTTTSCLRPCGS